MMSARKTIPPLTRVLTAAARGRRGQAGFITKSNAHEAALELAEGMLRRVWLEADPESYAKLPNPIGAVDFCQFDPASVAERWAIVCRSGVTCFRFDEAELTLSCEEEWACATVGSPTSGTSLPQPTGEERLSARDLAKRFDVPPEPLRKRLERWREQNQDGRDWVEVEDRGTREPRFLYRLSAVKPVIDDLKASPKRPTKKSSRP
jgi:hypothetical protein